jgi:hypothetical protein
MRTSKRSPDTAAAKAIVAGCPLAGGGGLGALWARGR